MLTLPDHYRDLGVSPQAPRADIQAAYRRRLRQAHPDLGGDLNEFHLVQEAWETLSDPKARREYDLLRFGRRAARRYGTVAAAYDQHRYHNWRYSSWPFAKKRRGFREACGQRASGLLAAIAACLAGRSRAWRKTEWAADLSQNPHPVRYALGLIRAAVQVRWESALRRAVRGLCWALASEAWTWTPLGGLLAWAGWETTLSAGPGSALLLVFTGAATLYAAVQGVRRYFGVKMRRKPKRHQEESDS